MFSSKKRTVIAGRWKITIWYISFLKELSCSLNTGMIVKRKGGLGARATVFRNILVD